MDSLRQVSLGLIVSCAAFAGGVFLIEAVGSAVLPAFFAAVIVAAWFGGAIAAGVCVTLGVPMMIFLVPPSYDMAVENDEDWVRIGLFVVVSGMIITLDHYRRRSREGDIRTRQELEDNQERLRVALDAGGMGTFQWHILNQELTWSPGVEVLHGVEGGITSGSVLLLMEAIHPEDRELFQLTITKSLRSGAPDLDADYRVLLPDGGLRWMAIKGRVKHEKSGLPSMISGVVWDMTERKEHENILRESEERFRLLADSSPVLIWMNGLDGCEFVNSEYLAYVGKPLEDVLGMRWAEAVHPEDSEEYLGSYARAVETREIFDSQVRLLGVDGKYRWFKSVGTPRLSPRGELLGYIGSSFDVNDLKLAQERIEESEERFRTMADSAPVLIWLSDTNKKGTWFNKEWLEFTGRSPEDERGAGWTASVHPDDVDDAIATGNAAFDAREEFRMEFRLRRHDGEYRWVLNHGVPRYGSQSDFQGYIGSCIDVHERKREEVYRDVLLRAGASLATTLDLDETLRQVANLPVPDMGDLCVVHLIGEAGSPGQVVPAAADPELVRILAEFGSKYPGAGKPESLRIRAITERRTMFYPRVDDELLRGLTQSEAQREFLRRLQANSIVAVPLIAHGEPIGSLTLAVTASSGRRYTQADVLAAEGFAQRAALALVNARLYTRAQETQEELRQLNAAKDEFVGMVSHELRTPITTVFSGARFLRSRADNLDDETGREVLADIEQEAARLELIVENLLALARQEAGKEPEVGPLAINRIVKGAVTRMQNLRPSRPFHLTPSDEPHLASGVPIYMELVLRNLLDNADKYSPAGKPIEITAQSDNGTVEVLVRDYGPGLNEDDSEKVFEQFYRSGTTNGVSGTGVGLAVCRRLMESQGGKISLANHADGGLEACLTLPVFGEDAEG